MKMQNIIKSEIEGKIKDVNVKAGDSVAVDELLIQFEWREKDLSKEYAFNKLISIFKFLHF